MLMAKLKRTVNLFLPQLFFNFEHHTVKDISKSRFFLGGGGGGVNNSCAANNQN